MAAGGALFLNGVTATFGAGTQSVASNIAGTGGITKAGAGTLTLSADNSYSGGTTIAAGTLQLGNGGSSGSILGNVADNGTLAFDRGDTVTFPGVISGTGGLAQIGLGTTILTADSTYSGGTTISAGTLAVNGGTLSASNTIIVGPPPGGSGTPHYRRGAGSATTQNLIVGQSGVGVLAVQNGGTWTDSGEFVGQLSGSQGTVTVFGAGSTLTNTDTIQVGGLGTGTLTIQNGGTVNSMGGGSIGLSAGSTGAVTVTGPGSSWNNSPGGGLNIGSFGTGTLTIANGGMVINNTAFAANIGKGAGSQGTVTVTGVAPRGATAQG